MTEIKQIGVQDLHALQTISRQTFSETFGTQNSAADMKKYLEESFSTEKLMQELSDQGPGFYFAMVDREPAGYLKVNFGESQTEFREARSMEIERIYVLRDFHGQKVGQALLDAAIHIAKEAGMETVWLGVWEKNERAIGFYRKNGFVMFGSHIFRLGDDVQTDILMRRALA